MHFEVFVSLDIILLCWAFGFLWKSSIPFANNLIPIALAILGTVASVFTSGCTVQAITIGLMSAVVAVGMYEYISKIVFAGVGKVIGTLIPIDEEFDFIEDRDEEVDDVFYFPYGEGLEEVEE